MSQTITKLMTNSLESEMLLDNAPVGYVNVYTYLG